MFFKYTLIKGLVMKEFKVWIRCKKEDNQSLNVAMKIADMLEKKGCIVYFHPYIADKTGVQKEKILYEKYVNQENIDIVVVVGGDGTLLHTVHGLIGRAPKILGINVESVGFLYDYDYHEIDRVVKLLEEEKLSIRYRSMGQINYRSDNSFSKEFFLNEIAIFNEDFFRILKFKVLLDDEELYEGRADALIVATTTGSSAYALSSGGPIVDEELECFVIVPVSPFSVLLKPVVVSPNRRIKIIPENNIVAIIDGLKKINFSKGDVLEVSKSGVLVPFLTGFSKKTFSRRLLNRLLDKVWSFDID